MIFLIRMFWLMPRYRLNYGDVHEFDAQGAGEVVPVMQGRHYLGSGEDEFVFMRRAAIEMCEWNKGTYYYDSRSSFADSMVRNGMLERVSYMD